jgi:hypothetical protein
MVAPGGGVWNRRTARCALAWACSSRLASPRLERALIPSARVATAATAAPPSSAVVGHDDVVPDRID